MSTGIYLSAAQAAKLTGVNKSTIVRAIKAGRLSAIKNDKGGWDIDPAELYRVFPAATVPPEALGTMHQHATSNATADEVDLKIAVAKLQAEREAQQTIIEELRERVDEHRERTAEAQRERDKWQEQARTLALTDQRRDEASSSGWFARTFGARKPAA